MLNSFQHLDLSVGEILNQVQDDSPKKYKFSFFVRFGLNLNLNLSLPFFSSFLFDCLVAAEDRALGAGPFPDIVIPCDVEMDGHEGDDRPH